MFSKKIRHPKFIDLTRSLFGYYGRIDFLDSKNIEIDINGRSESNLGFAVDSMDKLKANYSKYLQKATDEAFDSYKIMKDVVESGEYDLSANGGELPNFVNASEVWSYMTLKEISIETEAKNIRLGFDSPWDIEHDFGIYVTNGEFQYCGVSV